MEFNFDEIYNQILKEKEACTDPCGICYGQLNKKIIELKCKHQFHYKCLYKLRKFKKIECPYCRNIQTLKSLENVKLKLMVFL